MSRSRHAVALALTLVAFTFTLPNCTRDVFLDAPPPVPSPDVGPTIFIPPNDAAAGDAEGGRSAEGLMCPSDKCSAPHETCSTSKYLCDIDLSTDSNNCGACNNKCPTDPWREQNLHAKWICVDSGCKMACSSFLWADCNGRIEDGCETPMGTTDNCGACGVACAPGAACVSGVCTSCKPGETRCNNLCVNLAENDFHCGACGKQCPRLPPGFPAAGRNAYYGCGESNCNEWKCTSPWYDCNDNQADGCEVNLGNDVANCGQCGKACAAGEICVVGVCQCNPGPSKCDCLESFESDVMNCGACGLKCPERTNSTPTCKFAVCGSQCNLAFGDCNHDPADGCETELAKNPQHCGACGVACATGQACIDGACAVEPCPPGVIQ